MSKKRTPTKKCHNCHKPESEWPTIFKGGAWCSDDCRKIISGEVTVVRAQAHAGNPTVRINTGTKIV